VFSTKNREPFLSDSFRDELHAYIGGIVEKRVGTLLHAGSVADHIHLLIALPRTMSPSDLVRDIKAGASNFLDSKMPNASFHWQAGYGMFSISPSHRAEVEKYIDGQAEHHRVVTFQEEYRRLLEKYGIEYDEKYVLD
jgi:REP element-mobilizing transposase RayT